MKIVKLIFFFLGLIIVTSSFAQENLYELKLLPFNSNDADEFSPIFYDSSIVFCSNRKNKILVDYKTINNKQLLDIYMVSGINDSVLGKPKIFSKDLMTIFHDGPACFNNEQNIIYFDRNNFIKSKLKDVYDPGNKIGIYIAELKDNTWTNIHPFKYNSTEYMVMHPSLSEDGKELFFASDFNGGYGGTDIYSCKLIGNEWSQPVNLGPKVNSTLNEMFPFIHSTGNLYFSSAGHNSIGGLDIFSTKIIDGNWIDPEPIAKPINSEFDDFSFITDSEFKTGYFSSNRGNTDDIYYFKLISIKIDKPDSIIEKCDSLQENNYCFIFTEANTPDTSMLVYEWDLGDGTKIKALKAEHCYEKPGYYEVKLNVYDPLPNEKFTNIVTNILNIEDIEQVYISSVDTCLINTEIKFDGTKTNLKNFNIKEFSWDFNDGKFKNDSVTTHVFTQEGTFPVKLFVTGIEDSSMSYKTKCSVKNIIVKSDTFLNNEFENIQFSESKNTDELFTKSISDSSVSIIKDHCKKMENSNICYVFSEHGSGFSSSVRYQVYDWDFGDGEKGNGAEIEHCYTKSGIYNIKLNIVDTLSGEKFTNATSYKLIVNGTENVFINSADTCQINTQIKFEGVVSNSPDINEYLWDFSNENVGIGPYVTNVYTKPGVYPAYMKVIYNPDSSGLIQEKCVYKNIIVLESFFPGNSLENEQYSESKVSEEMIINNPSDSTILASANIIKENCKKMKNSFNSYVFSESGSLNFKNKFQIFEWDFGDGFKSKGTEVEHRYSKSGNYTINLNVVDTLSDEIFNNVSSYNLTVEDSEQVYINSADTCQVNTQINFDGVISNIPNFVIKEYYWDFSNNKGGVGKNVSNVFSKPGVYPVYMKVISNVDSSGKFQEICIYKNITVFEKTP